MSTKWTDEQLESRLMQWSTRLDAGEDLNIELRTTSISSLPDSIGYLLRYGPTEVMLTEIQAQRVRVWMQEYRDPSRRIAREVACKLVQTGTLTGEQGSPHVEEAGDLTEICQLFGKPIYVRLDWRNPQKAKYELEQIRSMIEGAFRQAYGFRYSKGQERETTE